MLAEDMKATATDITAQVVHLALAARDHGLSPVEAACLLIGGLKGVVRDLGADRERVARFA